MSEQTGSSDEGGRKSHKGRWFALFALAVAAAAFGRQMAVGSADRKFEERLRQLDDNRD
jgi:hypothetical protein